MPDFGLPLRGFRLKGGNYIALVAPAPSLIGTDRHNPCANLFQTYASFCAAQDLTEPVWSPCCFPPQRAAADENRLTGKNVEARVSDGHVEIFVVADMPPYMCAAMTRAKRIAFCV